MENQRGQALLAATLLLAVAGLAGESARPEAEIAWAPDGKVLIAAQGLLARFELDSDKEELLDDTVLAFALSPPAAFGGVWLAVAGPEEVSLRSYPDFTWEAALPLPEPESGKPETGRPESGAAKAAAPGAVEALAWSPAASTAGRNGETLAGGTANGHVLLWAIEAQAPAASQLWADLAIEPPSAVVRLTFSADGKRLLAAFEDARAVLWDIVERQELARFGPPRSLGAKGQPAAEATSMILSPDGRQVLVTQAWGEQAEMSLLAESGEVVWRRSGLGLEFTPDGSGVLALAPPFRIAALYRAADAEALRVFEPPFGVERLHAARLSPDGKQLAAVGEDARGQVLFVWDVATGRVLKTRR